jgi:hypothetical protein
MARNRSAATLRPVFYPIALLCFQPAACQFIFEIVFHIVDFKICRLESKGSHAETVTEARGRPRPMVARSLLSVIKSYNRTCRWLAFIFFSR